MTDDSAITGNWDYDASVAVNIRYSKAVHESMHRVEPAPVHEAPPMEVNLTLRQQKHFNRKDARRKMKWDSTSKKWQQESEQKWKAKNAREVVSLKSQVGE